MKLTLIRKDKKNHTHVTMKSMEAMMERITTDTKTEDVQNLRRFLASTADKAFLNTHTEKLHRIYPSAELEKDANGNLVMRQMNGIVMLSVRNVLGREAQQRVKLLAGNMPTTLAAFTGSSGRSVKVLVSVERADGIVPATEEEADRFLQSAFDFVTPVYQALFGYEIDRRPATTRTSFLMTLDAQPLYHPAATAFRIAALPQSAAALPEPPEAKVQLQHDYDLYMEYEQLYKEAVQQAAELAGDDPDDNAYFAELARRLCQLNVPEEEAVLHIWAHHKFNPPMPEARLRAIVEASYAETKPDRRRNTENIGRETRDLIAYLESRYVFRYNRVMGYTEYRPNNTWVQDWKPVDERVVNGFTTSARLYGLNVWDKDVTRYVKSDRIRNYDPIEDYLWRVHSKWDGQDHIGRLAQTVPTDNPHWPRWFRTWLLAMVAQWKGRNRRYGNSVAPLLISQQGYNKSTFCRLLLPDELQWGYTDNLSLDEKRPVLQAMSQMLLINLDEFNQISARTQEGFLKNIIQLARVKAKRPYGRHIEDFPRLASFIATTNMSDVLADPSGNRRFIGVELTGPIDVSTPPNHEQLYAQAQVLLEQGEPYWFDEQETQLIMRHNRQFQLKSPVEQYFGMLYEAADEGEPQGQWLTATQIFQHLRKVGGTALKQPNLIAFGRMLTNMEGMQRRHGVSGTEYWVRER